MISQGGWPVYDPAANTLSDIYGYVEFEIEYEIDLDNELDLIGPDDPTVVMPAARLVERCQTSAALRNEP